MGRCVGVGGGGCLGQGGMMAKSKQESALLRGMPVESPPQPPQTSPVQLIPRMQHPRPRAAPCAPSVPPYLPARDSEASDSRASARWGCICSSLWATSASKR